MSQLLEIVITHIVNFITALGYWGIGIGMAIESADIPPPSEVILPFGSYLVSTGKLSSWGTVIAGAVLSVAYLVGLASTS